MLQVLLARWGHRWVGLSTLRVWLSWCRHPPKSQSQAELRFFQASLFAGGGCVVCD